MRTYTIAICDILGFTKLVKHNPLEKVVEQSLSWFTKSLYHSMHGGQFPSETPTLSALRAHGRLGVAWFSDTILLYTLEDDDQCLQSLISCVMWLLFETMFTDDVRVRCGISYGKAFIDIDNSIYVGEPIIDAYHLESQQAWSGGALSASASERVPRQFRSGRLIEWPLIHYPVPFKDGSVSETLAINWTFGSHPSLEIHWSEKFEEPTAQDRKVQPGLTEKWQNTKIFHQKVCRTCARTT